MGVTFLIIAAIAGLLAGAFSKVLAEEFRAWAPTIARYFLEAAVRRLPDLDRERYREEWLAHVNETPGDLGKIFAAAGTNIAAWKMSDVDEKYPRLRRAHLFPKRAIDIVTSSVSLCLLAPLFAVLAIAIRLESPGPVLYRQLREGRDGRVIYVLRLRTVSYEDRNYTRVGRFMCKTNLNELPQLINVLMGDMSFVGPRSQPVKGLQPRRMGELDVAERDRSKVRPGITGLAQLNVDRYADEEIVRKDRLEADLRYIRNHSIWLDLKIIWQTILRNFR